MPTLNEIKSHIKAIEQTRQITNAMYLLSASKMKTTIKKAEYNVQYMRRLRSTMKDIIVHTDTKLTHRYIGDDEPKNALFLIITGDKGLCGGYNNNILQFAHECLELYPDMNKKYALIGLIGEEHFVSKGITPDFVWRGMIQNPTMHSSRTIADTIFEEYDKGRVDAVYCIFTRYKDSMSQTPYMTKLLPLSEKRMNDVDVECRYSGELTFFPSPSEVLSKVIPQYVISMIFNTLLQSCASEHASRMTSMQTATNNADEMLNNLQKEYNMQRQLAITSEITEISATTQTLSDKAI